MAKITEKKAKKSALQVNENTIDAVEVKAEEVKEPEVKWEGCKILEWLERIRAATGQNQFSFDEIKAVLNSVFKK